MLASRRGAIGTRLLNLNGADSDHPEPMVQDIWPGGTGGEPFEGTRHVERVPFLTYKTACLPAGLHRRHSQNELAKHACNGPEYLDFQWLADRFESEQAQ